MPYRNNRSIRPLSLLFSLLVAVLACSAHGQAMKGMANPGAAAHADAARPDNYVFLDPSEGQHGSSPDKGEHEGIKMHGHWVIDVKNPDGTLAEHRDFENSIGFQGEYILVDLLAGYMVGSGNLGIVLQASTALGAPCAPTTTNSNQTGCALVPSTTGTLGTGLCYLYGCQPGLTVTVGSASPTLTLAGSITATQAGTISQVSSYFWGCENAVVTSLTSNSPTACAAGTFTGTSLYEELSYTTLSTPISVVNTQIIQATVTITFS